MDEMIVRKRPSRRGRKQGIREPQASAPTFLKLRNPFPPVSLVSEDHVAALHQAALDVLQHDGIRVLLDEACDLFRMAGARIDNDHVWLDADLVNDLIAKAPSTFTLHARKQAHSLEVGGNSLLFGIGAGCPNINDRIRGRRAGTLSDFEDTTRLQQATAIVSKLAPSIEPQDVPLNQRHLDVTASQALLSDKVPFAYARGRAQLEDIFHIQKLALGINPEEPFDRPVIYTVINTNSPRQLDAPMSQGLIDFARAGQPSVVTPFCLAGAMAPTSLEGALILSHAEAMAGIALAQLARPGAPVVYGAFSSNVDMRSGAPLFGTPEHMKANLVAGQLARFVKLPWRSGSGTAANSADAQAASETQLATWSCLQAGANFIYHALGWLEGGLTFSYEKFALDVEAAEIIARSFEPVDKARIKTALAAISEVEPGGHFFGSAHTMSNYRTAFYDHQVFSAANYGQWHEAGEKSAEELATNRWQEMLESYVEPDIASERREAIGDFVARRKREGGALPLS